MKCPRGNRDETFDKIKLTKQVKLIHSLYNRTFLINTISLLFLLLLLFHAESSSFLDLCTNTTKTTDSLVHLISSSRATFYKDCECHIKGLESLVLNDVRLKSRNEEKCSPSKLLIKFDRYSCNGSADDYGSVFKQRLKETSIATVLFAAKSRSVEPESVWLILQPKGKNTPRTTYVTPT